ncbi:NAD(P)-binding protein [Pleurotus eryngii]|uniref:NAD(P)-binding protein n=1 Tax=Pleurotus eryngii TaxID=5323 RepID=A0A9P6D991_PLEER|nr:NAD(P)-binding protein [Pleurotus eryngii]
MKVIVVGATGFIGFPVAQALARAGHIVYGLTRSEANAKKLAAEEIIPVIAEPTSTSWHHLVAKLDVVIESIGGFPDLAQASNAIIKGVSESATKLRPPGAPKLTYIYTSGTWVQGDSRTEIVSDTTPLSIPVQLTAWRIPLEQAVITSTTLNGIVIRPALLYGRGGSLFETLFKSAQAGKVAWYGTPGGRFALVHADDLADLYVRAAEKAQIIGGQIFDAANDFTESADDFLEHLVRLTGTKTPYKYIEPSNLFEEALGATLLLRPYLARALLGWTPRKPGLVDGLETYYASWRALQ